MKTTYKGGMPKDSSHAAHRHSTGFGEAPEGGGALSRKPNRTVIRDAGTAERKHRDSKAKE